MLFTYEKKVLKNLLDIQKKVLTFAAALLKRGSLAGEEKGSESF